MTKVLIDGYSSSEGVREFDILELQELQSIIADLSEFEIFSQTWEKASGYYHSGSAYTYVDARDGEVYTTWQQNNTHDHPWDSFYEIVVCSLTTGAGALDVEDEEHLLDDDDPQEMKRWREFRGSFLEFFGEEEYQERMDNAIEWEAEEFEFDWEGISDQIRRLYA